MSYIGCDLDGTLAHHGKGDSVETIGAPIPEMVARVKAWLAEGTEVRIITARVARNYDDNVDQRGMICDWCEKHLGRTLPVQDYKCGGMLELWDDRAVGVVRNTGLRATDVAFDDALGKIATWLEGALEEYRDGDTPDRILAGLLAGVWR